MLDERPLMVTIRCLCYNHEPYIKQCLEGFLMQKTNFRFEAVVHDDASTDGSAAIIREYAEKYPDIIKPIFEKENQYSKKDGSLRRIMDEQMKGKYIAVCEGDDYWIDPLKLQKQVDFMENHHDYTMCFHNAIVQFMRPVQFEPFALFDEGDLSSYDAINKWLVPSASVLFRQDMVSYPSWLANIYSGDYALILRCVNGGKIYGMKDYMSVYRKNFSGNSVSMNMRNKQLIHYKHHKILLESFDKGTHYKFNQEIKERIKYLNRMINFYRAKENGEWWRYATSLDILFVKIWGRVKYYINSVLQNE